MEYNWNSIKETIKLNCEHVFSESSLSYTIDDLEEALIIFNNFLLYPMPGCDSIRGLENNFVEALQQACLNAEGIQSYLDTITTDFEPFMKKLLILTGSLHYANLTARTWMFERLFRQLTIAPTFYSEGKTLAAIESTIEDYKTNQEGIYIIAKARLCRNEIHNAKYLDLQQIGATLKYALGMYVWLILKTKNSLISHIPELSREQMEISPTDLDNQYLYDFLSFGQTANEVKNKFVDSYILNRIYNHEPKKVAELINEVEAFSKGSLNADSIKRFLEKLKDKRKIHYSNPGCTEVQLSSSEHERIKNSASVMS